MLLGQSISKNNDGDVKYRVLDELLTGHSLGGNNKKRALLRGHAQGPGLKPPVMSHGLWYDKR